jgi:hypothetical protein
LLNELESLENAKVMLCWTTAAENIIRRLFLIEEAVWHDVDVSDCQEEDSHDDSPALCEGLSKKPRLDPARTKLFDPVVASFDTSDTLKGAKKYEILALLLDMQSPTVAETARVVPPPRHDNPRIDVSEIQVLDLETDEPIRNTIHASINPKTEPNKDTIDEPVIYMFWIWSELMIATVVEKPADKVPNSPAAVTDKNRLPLVLSP